MLVTKIYLAAMSRADVSAATLALLPSFYFYVDEFQTFANQSFADILSEARKYKLNLIIAHQYIEQMEEEVRDAVFGNVGTTVTFRVGPFDAEVLETIFNPQFTAQDLVNLGAFQLYLTLMIDGVGSPPFSATTLPPFDKPPQTFVNEVMANSREQFGKQRVEVEGAIEKWHEMDREGAPTPKPKEERRPYSNSSSSVSTARPAMARPPERPLTTAPRRDTRPPPKSAEPRPEAPALGGAKSLREALAQATGMHMEQAPPRDLKETLSAIVPPVPAKSAPLPKPAALPDEVLRSMLAVDETGDQSS